MWTSERDAMCEGSGRCDVTVARISKKRSSARGSIGWEALRVEEIITHGAGHGSGFVLV
jgi:hypothetical protein